MDPDLALLAGDYLYALGLERLAALGDLDAVRELSDLISLAAQIHDGSRTPEAAAPAAKALWLSSAAAIGAGASTAHDEAKAKLGGESGGAPSGAGSGSPEGGSGPQGRAWARCRRNRLPRGPPLRLG